MRTDDKSTLPESSLFYHENPHGFSHRRNDLCYRVLGHNALAPFPDGVSSPRANMQCQHSTQAVPVAKPTPPRLRTGIERKFGKYTFDVRVDVDIEVMALLPRYPADIRYGGHVEHVLVYHDKNSGQVESLELPAYHSLHPRFGYKFVPTEAYHALRDGKREFRAGTVFFRSPNISKDGEWRYGVEMMVMAVSHPVGLEDGYGVRESKMKDLAPTTFNTYSYMFGESIIPTNVHGKPDGPYMIVPDIGQSVGPDKPLMNFREWNETDGVITLSNESLCEIMMLDKSIYCPPDSVVVDIRVTCNHGTSATPLPFGADAQLKKYFSAENRFYHNVLDIWCRVGKESGKYLNLGTAFSRLIENAINRVGHEYRPPNGMRLPEAFDVSGVTNTYCRQPIPNWCISVTVMNSVDVGDGLKISDRYGTKGVTCGTIPDHLMPDGVDVIRVDTAAINRLNCPSLAEIYINSCSNKLTQDLRAEVGLPETRDYLEEIDPKYLPSSISLNSPLVDSIFERLVRYYSIASPTMYESMRKLIKMGHDLESARARLRHVTAVLCGGLGLIVHPDCKYYNDEVHERLMDEYEPTRVHLSVANSRGEMIKLNNKVTVGSQYFMVHERTGDALGAVASAKENQWGVASRLTASDRNGAPVRQQLTKLNGEAETALTHAVAGAEYLAASAEMNSNPAAHAQICEKIMRTRTFGNVRSFRDYREVPFGGHRPLQYIGHINTCSGRGFVRDYDEEKDN